MDDHDQPMSFLELPWTHCIATCKALAYDRLSLHVAPLAKAMEPGWGLASSQVAWWPGLSKSCRLPAAATKLFRLKLHLEPCHEGRQT